MIRRLIILLLIVGCEETLEPQDCAGVAGGTAVEDCAGVCGGIDGYVAGTCYDCADTPNGDAVVDNCGVCDNDATNNCDKDCADEWGGDAEFDDCGICDSNISNDCVQDCLGVWGGDAIDDDDDGICDILQGTVTDIDENVYQTVQIGDQLWMAENLKVTHYNDGSEITHIINSDDWGNYNEGQYGVYDNDPSNANIYGNLYNWYPVDDDRGVCPEGFHVPTDEEFMELEMFLGMSEEDANGIGFRGTEEGSKLAGNSDLWMDDHHLVNNSEFGTSGFNGLPAGFRYEGSGDYNLMGNRGSFWSSSEISSANVWYRNLNDFSPRAYRNDVHKRLGFSIRCLGD